MSFWASLLEESTLTRAKE
jgi:hypothetical protein